MSAPPATAPAGIVSARAGDVIADKYRLERVIGAGGVGVVFAATHLALDQRVAVKLLQRAALGSDENLARFSREVKVLARLRSEHVARVMDAGLLPSGEPFMVLEHLEGEDLGAVLLARKRLPVGEAVDIVAEVCEGVSLAHGLGVIHRDLKPANVFLTKGPDGAPIAKVLDFGISKVRDPAEGDSAVTRTLSVLGSPLYMAPEQIESATEASERSDVWSLGVILYELIAGKAPFDAPTLPLLCANICTGVPTPISHHVQGVPDALSAVLLRCIEKDPKARFGSVAELAQALAPFGGLIAREAARRATRIAESHGLLAPEAPESAGRRWSWSTIPPGPRPRRRRARAAAIAGAAALATLTVLWLARERGRSEALAEEDARRSAAAAAPSPGAPPATEALRPETGAERVAAGPVAATAEPSASSASTAPSATPSDPGNARRSVPARPRPTAPPKPANPEDVLSER